MSVHDYPRRASIAKAAELSFVMDDLEVIKAGRNAGAHHPAAYSARWLTTRGFVPGTGDLRRQVRGSDPGP